MWRSRLKDPATSELETEPVPKPEDSQNASLTPREAAWAALQRARDRAAALDVAQALEAPAQALEAPAQTPISAVSPEIHRGAYFRPGGYAGGTAAPSPERSPDPNLRLEVWVARELNRAGLPSWLCGVVVRMALITMRDGVEVARRALLAEPSVPEEFHFAIDGILKLIPPLI